MGIDMGRKRCGIAVTDPMCIVANGLTTVRTCDLIDFVRTYASGEALQLIVIGEPRDMHDNPSESTRFIEPVIKRLAAALPAVEIRRYDERFTSVLAHRAIIESGVSRTRRRDKALVDQISATIILNDYLQSINSI